MNFSSINFLFLFLPVILPVYFLAPLKFRNVILILFSFLFYFLGEKAFVLLLLFSCVFNFFIGKNIENKGGRGVLILGIVVNILLLAVFKYLNFFIEQINNLQIFPIIAQTNIHLPVGISFFTFQAVSYLIDIKRKEIAPANFEGFTLYLSSFPQLVAGPIVRYKEIQDKIFHRKITKEDFEGRVPFSNEKIEKIIQNNKIREKKLSPAKFYILIPPDKTVIYSEFLPDNIQSKENIKNSRITGLLTANAALKENLEIIYPKNILVQNKEKGALYFTTDTHWTNLGAYFGYVELIKTIQKDFSNLKPLNIKDFEKEEYIYNKPDLANIVNVGAKNTEKSEKYICKNKEETALKVLVFGDSFYESLEPYLKCTFKDVKFINSNTINAKAVKDFMPDIIILEIVQRNIRQLEISDK